MRKIYVKPFRPGSEIDGLFKPGETARLPCVSLHFPFDGQLVAFLKSRLERLRPKRRRDGHDRPKAGRWSTESRCWVVRSKHWPCMREWLLVEGVTLIGPAAHPGKPQKVGFFEEREQHWSVDDCAWKY